MRYRSAFDHSAGGPVASLRYAHKRKLPGRPGRCRLSLFLHGAAAAQDGTQAVSVATKPAITPADARRTADILRNDATRADLIHVLDTIAAAAPRIDTSARDRQRIGIAGYTGFPGARRRCPVGHARPWPRRVRPSRAGPECAGPECV